MKFQIVSDLHLEFRGNNFINLFVPSAPVLCMVGDICACGNPDDFAVFVNFLKYITPKYSCVLHVAGNHEYYTAGSSNNQIANNTMADIDLRLKNLTKTFSNYHYLNNSTFELVSKKGKHYVFIGTTLWSQIPKKKVIINEKKHTSMELADLIEKRMNDYNHIYVRTKANVVRRYTIVDMQKKHKQAVTFIKKELNKAKSNNIYILLTHHKPIFDRNSDEQDMLTYAYESPLQDIIIKSPLKLAAHGHTHIPYNKIVNKVRVISNPKGYPNERTQFNDKLAISI